MRYEVSAESHYMTCYAFYFKINLFVFNQRKEVIYIWHDMNYSFKAVNIADGSDKQRHI